MSSPINPSVPLLNGEFFKNDVERHGDHLPVRVADGADAEKLVDASAKEPVPVTTVTQTPFLTNSNHGSATAPKKRPPARRRLPLDLHAVWARWAVRATTTGDPWAYHVAEFYRRLALMETHHVP